MGKELVKNTYEGPMDMDNGVGMDYRSEGWAVQRGAKGETLGQLTT